ncbi:MAG: helix-turn-helix domain-containing protein [Oscillospiraceae bacterium]|nr:helix-turn-helix domain-containing protein [Oscillospiraceae bacterium]
MNTKDIILELRTKLGLSQEELAEKVFVTRQAVSRWENGETTPNTETLKLLSKLFNVSINTLLGSPRQLICQCCGMPLEDSSISKETDGFFNEEYCKWCYADGEYMYHDMDDLIEVCVSHMASDAFTPEQVRAYMRDLLPKLGYWKNHTNLNGADEFEAFKKLLIDEINALHIEGMPKVEKLNALVGGYINLEYQLPNGTRVKFLDDGATYLGTQLESELENGRCFGIAANVDFILVCTYEENGESPELIVYKKRAT